MNTNENCRHRRSPSRPGKVIVFATREAQLTVFFELAVDTW
jgi:hypothetical protein